MHYKSGFFGAVLLLLALRFLHFGPAIDAPHDWRQCDTAHYIRDFYENGIDLLHPAVCWMGASDTLALEFPMPEAIVAVAYQCIGGESIPLARAVFLCFFMVALFYYYKIICLLFGKHLAQWATLVYLVLPLSIYYSRAVHIDFSAVASAHAMVYYFLLGVREKRRRYMAASGLAAVFVFLIKPPYAFYFSLPMLAYTASSKQLKWVLRQAIWYLPGVVAFWLWQKHVNAINGAAPNLDYILHYRKMTQNAGWYFGTLQQRLSLYPWWILLQRGVLEVAGAVGIVFFLLGWRGFRALPSWHFLLFWMLGLALYVLLFFNLNFVHNYYQIPLLAPVAVLGARGILSISPSKPWMKWLLLGLLLLTNWMYCEKYYYEVAADHVEIGTVIRENTPDTALVIVSYNTMDCRNPKILHRARRRGWSVEEAAIKPEVIRRLQQEQGARYWAYSGPPLEQKGMEGYLKTLPPPRVFNLNSVSQPLYIFDLTTK